MNPPNLKELAEQIAIPVRHLRYLLEQMEWHIPKATVWAFGSRIKWSHRPESDLDLAVHCDKETARKDIPKLNDVLQESDLPFKVQILDFNRLPGNMQENIKKNYLVLYHPQEIPWPSGWKETTLGKVGKVVTGKTPSKDNPEHWGDLMCFVTPSDIKNDSKYIYQTERYISQEGLEAFERMVIPRNSVIVTCIGSDMGKVVTNSHDCITNQQINSLIINNGEYDRDFVYYRLKDSYSLLRSHADGGSTMPILNKSTFESLTFYFPPLPEQKAIAAILSGFDDKIELLRRQNKTLESIARTLFRKWFIEEAQADWETVRIGDVVKTNALSIDNDFGLEIIKYLDTSSITEGEINGVQCLNIKDLPSRAKRIVKHNDILISTVRPDQKHYGIMKRPAENLIVSTGFCVITCDTIDPHYIYILLTTVEMTEYLHLIAEGTTSAYPSLKPSDIEKIGFQRPPKEKLCTFSKYADKAWDKIDNNYSQIQTLSKLRDTLLPKLMRGEIRVKDIETKVE